MEITQFTYFQQMAGFECKPVSAEITYGLERITMFIQGVDSVFDIRWNNEGVKYGDVYKRNEKEFSAYNFEFANTDNLLKSFAMAESECQNILSKNLALPAYDQCLKASHIFNTLDARGVISVTERAGFINKIRTLVKSTAEVWLKNPD
jgi:glycyl-tRNA synthetase alpha chain